eukprot:SAG31_NODE_10605_length_1118_cov_1.136408_1_plen_216_part_10
MQINTHRFGYFVLQDRERAKESVERLRSREWEDQRRVGLATTAINAKLALQRATYYDRPHGSAPGKDIVPTASSGTNSGFNDGTTTCTVDTLPVCSLPATVDPNIDLTPAHVHVHETTDQNSLQRQRRDRLDALEQTLSQLKHQLEASQPMPRDNLELAAATDHVALGTEVDSLSCYSLSTDHPDGDETMSTFASELCDPEDMGKSMFFCLFVYSK